MSYVQKSYRAPVGCGMVIVLLVLARCGMMVSQMSANTPTSAEEALFRNPDTAAVYQAMKRTHPAEFAALTERIAALTRAGRSHDQIEAEIGRMMVTAEQKLLPDLMQAGPVAMAKYRHAEMDVIKALQAADPRLCADYVINGSLSIPRNMVAVTQSAVLALHLATWEAAADGRDHPARRKLTQPSNADWALIDKAMLADGVPRATLATFFNPKQAVLMPAQTQCSTGLSFRMAIETLPAPRVDDFFAAMMKAA